MQELLGLVIEQKVLAGEAGFIIGIIKRIAFSLPYSINPMSRSDSFSLFVWADLKANNCSKRKYWSWKLSIPGIKFFIVTCKNFAGILFPSLRIISSANPHLVHDADVSFYLKVRHVLF